MLVANYSEFRLNLWRFLDDVDNNNDTLIIKRGTGRGNVLISLNEYNSMIETMYLLKSKKNAEWIAESINQLKEGKVVRNKQVDEL